MWALSERGLETFAHDWMIVGNHYSNWLGWHHCFRLSLREKQCVSTWRKSLRESGSRYTRELPRRERRRTCPGGPAIGAAEGLLFPGQCSESVQHWRWRLGRHTEMWLPTSSV